MLERLMREGLDLRCEPGTLESPIRIDRAQLDLIAASLLVDVRDASTDPVGRITMEREEVEVDEEHATANLSLNALGAKLREVLED